MLPHFFRHYDPFVSRYFVLDNGSTDGSLAILDAHPRVAVTHFDVTGDSFVDEERRLSDSIWRGSCGCSDWVIMVDIDEFIFNPEFVDYLVECTKAGVTVLRSVGYEMVADQFPINPVPLVELITSGVRSIGHDKLCVFNPDALIETDFAVGRHNAAPKGRVIWPERRELLMLHYKHLGVEYVIQRSAELRSGLRTGDLEKGWGKQYLWSSAEIATNWVKLRVDCAPVPGLGTLKHIASADYDDEFLIGQSGLFDAPWYLEHYRDVGTEQGSALSHFCIHGWKEDRKPNFYFQPSWYLKHAVGARNFGRNPLLHYFQEGERAGAQPSKFFAPAWYREHYGLGEEKSPLAHYLAQKGTGLYSPLPNFDVEQYCAGRSKDAPELRDPYEEFHNYSGGGGNESSATLDAGRAKLPSYEQVVAAAGMDSEALREVLRPFLGHTVVDEDFYLRAYPDVATAIAKGDISSGREHFIDFGYFEGRVPSAELAND